MLNRRWSCCVAVSMFVSASTAGAATFEQLEGWWRATAAHDGRTTTVYAQFVQEEGKRLFKVSLPEIGVWGVSCGTLKIDGDRIDASDMPFPLEFDAATNTLHGDLPKDAVPVYRIPVQFERLAEAPTPPEPLKWEHPRPREAWSTQLAGPIWAGLAHDAHARLIIVAGEDGAITALNEDTGHKAWAVKVGGPVRARPAVADDTMLITCDDGHLYKLRASDGGEVWRAKIDAGSPPRLEPTEKETRYDRYASSAIVSGDRIFVGSRDGGLYALNKADGRQRWRADGRDMIISTPVVFGDLVIFGSFDGHVRAVAADTGELRWDHDAQGAIAGDLVLTDDRVLVGTRTYDLRALNANTGEWIWNFYYWFSWIESPPCVVDGVAYVGSSDALAGYAIDVATGKVKWERKMPGWTWPQPVAMGDAVVFAATGSRGPHHGMLLACDRSDGRVLWAQPGAKPNDGQQRQWGFSATPVVVGDRVIAADLSGKISALAAP